MFCLSILYGAPRDPDAFVAHYRAVHLPLVRQVPGLLHARWGRCEHPAGAGRAPVHFAIAVMEFADRAAYDAALKTSEMAATGKDLKNFADGGVTMVAWDAEELAAAD